MEDKYKTYEMDLIGVLMLLWSKRKTLIKACFIGGVLSIIIAFSIPKEYTSTAVLAPEFLTSTAGLSGGIGSLASMAGIDIGNLNGGEDALYPELYPQIVSSTPFLCDLMPLEVESKNGELKTDLYHYLRYKQRYPWWTKAMQAPIKLIKRMTTHTVDTIMPTNGSDMTMTRSQYLALKSLDKQIRVDIDKGNSVITLGVTMQDPKIASYVTQVVMDNLQEYIGNYRSVKARKDLAYMEQLYASARDKYYESQNSYARFVDQHQGLVMMQHQIEQDRLENERDLAFNVYNQVAGQLETAKAKVQESTPVCVVIQPPIMPFKASSPKKMMMGILYVIMAFFGSAAWIIIKDRIVRQKNVEIADKSHLALTE